MSPGEVPRPCARVQLSAEAVQRTSVALVLRRNPAATARAIPSIARFRAEST